MPAKGRNKKYTPDCISNNLFRQDSLSLASIKQNSPINSGQKRATANQGEKTREYYGNRCLFGEMKSWRNLIAPTE